MNEQQFNSLSSWAKLGDAKAIDEIKRVIIQLVKSGKTKCLDIQPLSSDMNDDVFRRARSTTFFGCQESSKTLIEDADTSVMWYYVSSKENLIKAKENMDEKKSGTSVIWIDLRYQSSLNHRDITKEMKGKGGEMKVVYIITKDRKRKDDSKIRGSIKEMLLINGRAGSGKTFLTMHSMLGLLTDNSNISDFRVPFTTKCMLLCLDAEPLGHDIIKWLCARLYVNASDMSQARSIQNEKPAPSH